MPKRITTIEQFYIVRDRKIERQYAINQNLDRYVIDYSDKPIVSSYERDRHKQHEGYGPASVWFESPPSSLTRNPDSFRFARRGRFLGLKARGEK